jgi:hypothetical protein
MRFIGAIIGPSVAVKSTSDRKRPEHAPLLFRFQAGEANYTGDCIVSL